MNEDLFSPASPRTAPARTDRYPLLVQLLACAGIRLGKTRLLELARKAGLRTEAARGYTPESLAAELVHFIRAGWVARSGSGFECASTICADAFREAAVAGRLHEWRDVLLELFGLSRYGVWVPSARTLGEAVAIARLALCAKLEKKELDLALRATSYFDPAQVYWTAFGEPFDPALFELMPPQLCDQVAERILAWMLYAPRPSARRLVEWAEQRTRRADASPALAYRTCEHLLWQGRFDDAAARLEGDDSGVGLALKGAAAAMRRDPARARELYAAALGALRKSGRQRHGLLPFATAWLYPAALIVLNQPATLEEAKRFCKGEAGVQNNRGLEWLWNRLGWLAEARLGDQPPEGASLLPQGKHGLADLVVIETSAWLRHRLPASAPGIVRRWIDTFAEAGYLWAAREFEAALAICTRAKLAAELSDTLAAAFANENPWQRALAAIAGLSEAQRMEAAATRLVWVLTLDRDCGAVTGLEPLEQRLGPRGWGKGKPVPLSRLAKAERLAPQDAQVCRAITSFGYELDIDRALPALIGHALVFFADDLATPVELVAGTPAIEVERRQQGFRVTLRPDLRALLARGNGERPAYNAERKIEPCLVVRETPTRARIVRVTAAHRRVAELVGKGLDVPAEGGADLERAVEAAARFFHVHSEVGAGIAEAAGDPALRAELAPAGAGLRLRLAVRPFGDAGPRYAPGEGGARVIAEVVGERRAAVRDLAGERARAARLLEACPMLLDEAHAFEWRIDDPEACLALVEALQGLEPELRVEWLEGARLRVSRPYAVQDLKLALRSARDWFVASGGLQLDEGALIEMARLVELARGSSGRYLPLGDGGFLALTEELKRRIEELTALGDVAEEGVRVHPLAAAVVEEIAEGAALEADPGWRARLERAREADRLEPELPSTLQAELRSYQLQGFQWLARLAHWGGGACLADDMGLGKTVQALALLLQRARGGPALVVAPTSVCPNWVEEAQRFAPTLNVRAFGAGERRKLIEEARPFDLVVCSYALLQQEVEVVTGRAWHTVVLDEAQAVKNFAAKRTQAVLALQADFRMVTTGTPVENRLDELWTLFRFLNPGLLGSRERFSERYAGPIERGREPRARARLKRLIRPFVLRRTKSEVLAELPPWTEIIHTVEPDQRERAFYESLRRTALASLERASGPLEQRRFQVLAELMRLRRACCDPRLAAPGADMIGGKLDAFAEIVDELVANRHKALVFSQFVDYLALLRGKLDEMGVRYQYLDGATPAAERGKRVAAFQAGEGDVFLISLRAGGFGLNLTAADYVIITDPWWNPAVEDQAAGRAHRIGQERPVTVYRLVVKDSIEERIMALHRDKRALAEGLFAGEEFGARVSVEDLVRLIREEG